jgi:hypothetical protein
MRIKPYLSQRNSPPRALTGATNCANEPNTLEAEDAVRRTDGPVYDSSSHPTFLYSWLNQGTFLNYAGHAPGLASALAGDSLGARYKNFCDKEYDRTSGQSAVAEAPTRSYSTRVARSLEFATQPSQLACPIGFR